MNIVNWWRTAAAVCALCAMAAIIAPAQTFTTLVTFDWTNGATPLYGALAQGLDGNLYGTTYQGDRYGFEMTPAGDLIRFGGSGPFPVAGLILGMDGSLYGTAYGGGATSLGSVYKITPEDVVTTLYAFSEYSEGVFPEST